AHPPSLLPSPPPPISPTSSSPFLIPQSSTLDRMKGLFFLLLLLCLGGLVHCVYIDDEALDEPYGTQPRLTAGEWSECSVSCGNGVQSRSIECRVSHPLAGNLKLPLDECRNLASPPLFRPCSVQNCAMKEEESRVEREDFHWKHSEWSPCSASCLGGKQRALLQCIQLSSGRPVAWSNCDGRRRPPERTRSCNAKPCPPEWVVSDWSACGSECGATRTRSVSCVATATHAGGAVATVQLNETECRMEKPPASEQCPATECGGWKVEDWSDCSVSCGRGEQRRAVRCTLPIQCLTARPESTKECQRDACPRNDEEAKEGKKLTLDLGGVATLFQGTNIKVKCPRKKEDAKKMYWLKDGEKLTNNAHIKVSSNGNLRISDARMEDAGLYECFTPSGPRGNVTIRFKLRENQEKLKGGKQLKKGKAKFKTGEWAECHQSNCQLRGIQERKLECFVTEGKSHRKVSNSICETLNISRPLTSRPCLRIDCAKWNATHWSPCNSSPCVRKWTSEQTRNVECLSSTGRKVELSHCEASSKPAMTTLCANPSCIPEWKTSDWNACSSTCGTGGVQLRLLHCVWSGTGKPAGKSCDGLQQPRTIRACSRTSPLPACPPRHEQEETPNCEDLSRFCDIIKLFHSCDSQHVKQRCCSTCKKIEKEKF
ncbi:hypothetical protein PENTCL1PPCAC_21652, partial [Pristionchus entomophagus]